MLSAFVHRSYILCILFITASHFSKLLWFLAAATSYLVFIISAAYVYECSWDSASLSLIYNWIFSVINYFIWASANSIFSIVWAWVYSGISYSFGSGFKNCMELSLFFIRTVGYKSTYLSSSMLLWQAMPINLPFILNQSLPLAVSRHVSRISPELHWFIFLTFLPWTPTSPSTRYTPNEFFSLNALLFRDVYFGQSPTQTNMSDRFAWELLN